MSFSTCNLKSNKIDRENMNFKPKTHSKSKHVEQKDINYLRDRNRVLRTHIQNTCPHRRICSLHRQAKSTVLHQKEKVKNEQTCMKSENHRHYTLSTGVTAPSFTVKRSDIDNDCEVSPYLRNAAPFSSKSLDNLS